jgi:hypothetical protein
VDESFPTDEATLTLLIASCRINPDTEQTHLGDFLQMGARVKSEELLSEDDDSAPVYLVEHEPGYEPFSPQQVIITLAEEVMRLRAALSADGNEGG